MQETNSYAKATGCKVVCMDMEGRFTKVEKSMRDTGNTGNEAAWGERSVQVALYMLEHGNMICLMGTF